MDERGQANGDGPARPRRLARAIAFAVAALLFAALQLGALDRPLLWQDEGETAMFGRRILDHGYPKVHGAEGVVYGMGVPLELAVDEERDAYLGSLWGQYYLAAVGVAWSDRVQDPYAMTWRVRLPFALAGLAGLALLLLAVRRELAVRSGDALPAATAFVLILCASISLQLHLREVRYYAPTLLGVGLAVALGRAAARPSASRGRALALTLALVGTLVATLNVFYPAALALMAWLAVEWLLDARRDRGGEAATRRGGLVRLAPVGVALLVAIPIAWAFDVLALSQAFSERWAFGPAAYAANLGHLFVFLLRHEMLGVLLLAEVAVALGRANAQADEPARRAALALLRLAALLAAVGAANPIFFERYFVALGPVLAMALVLDGEVLLGRHAARAGTPSDAARRRIGFAVLAFGLVATVVVRQGELVGRVQEILDPVAGPVDHVVATLRERHDDPSHLLVATNYEAEPLMFYLGSRVVGRFHSGRPEAIRAERSERPDVVVPRSSQPKRLPEVRAYLLAGGYAPRTLPVADTPYNAIPELYAGRVLARTHWFTRPVPGEADPPLVLYERRSAAQSSP